MGHGKGLVHFWRLLNSASPLYADAASDSIAVPILPRQRRGIGIPKNAQAALPKIDIRSKTGRLYVAKQSVLYAVPCFFA